MRNLISTLIKPVTAENITEAPRDASPYAGFALQRDTDVATGLAPCGPHLMVLAGSGIGKSRSVLVPSIITWDGPVCAVSAKSDLAEYAAEHRAHRGGPQYLMDLTGQADWSKLPEDMIALNNDPCAMLTPDANGSTDDAALDLATLLLQLGQLSMGGSKGGGGDSALWQQLALGTLACLLQAGVGYPDPVTGEWVDGGGIDWVRRAALNPGFVEETSEEIDLNTPSWDVAANRALLVDSCHVAEVDATKALDPKQRDSAGINMRAALGNWAKRSVRGLPGSAPFTPELLEDPTATFYLVSPDSGGGAVAAATVIESLVLHWKLNAVNKQLPKIAMVIDEYPQICPVALDKHVGVMRSYGMHFTVAAQHSSQLDLRFGEKMTKVLLNTFPSILIGLGAVEKDFLDQVAWTIPRTERKLEGDGHSVDRVEAHGSELLPRHRGEARLINRGLKGQFVKLVDFSQM